MQRLLALIQYGLNSFEMNIGRCGATEGRVMMFVVVPMEEFCGPGTSILLADEAFGEVRSKIQGLPGAARQGGYELGFRERIIVGDMWAGVCFRDTQIGHEQRHSFGSH